MVMSQRAGWIAMLLAAFLAAPASGRNAARVLESSDEQIVVELATDTYSVTEKEVGGESFMSIRAPGFRYTEEPGLPRLPKYVALVAVPFGSDLSLDVQSSESKNLGPFNPIPAPHEDIAWDGQMAVPTQDFTPDESYYRGSGAYPVKIAELGGQGTLRHQRIAAIVFYPFRHSAGTGTLTLHDRIVVKLSIEPGRRRPDLETAVPSEPEWERTYDHLILNLEQSRQWRMRPSRDRGVSSRARFGGEAYKITTLESGLHRVDYSELAAAGLAPDVRVDELAVYQRSFDSAQQDPFVQTPVAVSVFDAGEDGYFDGADYLLFQAQSFADEYMTVGYEDRYGDENAYWLSADPELALRMETRTGELSQPGLEPPVSFRDTVRFEQDVYFYARPEVIDLDLYHWTSYAAHGDNYSLPFALYGIEPGGDLRLRARYQGMTSSPHSIDIGVAHGDTSDYSIGTFEFTGVSLSMSEDIYESGPIPTWYLVDGDNRYETKGTSGLSYADLDWFEFQYDRLFVANAGRLSFTNAGEQGVSEFEVAGFDSDGIRLFDTTDPWHTVELLLDSSSITSGENGYTLTFQDDVSGFTRYEGVDDGGYFRAERIEKREDRNLRSDEADVIFISHEDFADSVEPLIAHRESQGWSVAHARVGEVYDEFSGGLKSTEAIKNYLSYAFGAWTTTPQFAVLVGDASEDTRGLASTSQPDYIPTRLGAGNFQYPQMTASDQWFISSDEAPWYLPWMFIGRLSVGSAVELSTVVSKILNYESGGEAGDWRSDVTFVADDQWHFGESNGPYYWSSGESDFTDISLELADMVAASPAGLDTTIFALRRYTDPFHEANGIDHQTQPWTYTIQVQNYVRGQVTPDLVDQLSQGAAIVNFEGHGNRTQMTHELLMMAYFDDPRNDIVDLRNDGKPFIFLGFSCHLAQFHSYQEGSSTGVESIAEQMVFLPFGRGAVAAFACAGAAQLDSNTDFNRDIFESFFIDPTQGGPPEDFFWPRWTLGSILATGTIKSTVGTIHPRPDRTYVLLGDPLLHLETSPPTIRVTLNGEPLVSDEYIEATGGEAVTFVADIIDEVEIDPASISVVETGGGEEGVMTIEAISDTSAEVSRWYRVTYQTTIQQRIYDIIFQATDLTGQTSRFVIHVPEGGGLVLRDVANYPNPFYDRTKIIYVLNKSDADVRVSIYTVGGRLIRRIEAPGDLNYNEVEWDGVDQDGDPVANGVYLFVIEAKGSDGRVVASDVGRMVVARGPRFDSMRR